MKKKEQVPKRTFKEIVYIAGSKYEIRDENIWRHYYSANQLVVNNKKIVGFSNKPRKTSSE